MDITSRYSPLCTPLDKGLNASDTDPHPPHPQTTAKEGECHRHLGGFSHPHNLLILSFLLHDIPPRHRLLFKRVVKIVGWQTVELVEKVCKHLSRRKKKVKW